MKYLLLQGLRGAGEAGEGVLPYKRLMGMRHWLGSHFHNWVDYDGVAFSIEVLVMGSHFQIFLV